MIKKVDSHFLISLSIFLLFYTIYRSEIYHSGSFRENYYPYYIVSNLLILYSISSYFLNIVIRLNIFFTIIFIPSTLVCYETYLIYSSQSFDKTLKEREIYLNNINKDLKFNYSPKIEVYLNLKKNNKNVSVPIPPETYLSGNFKYNSSILPLSGISNSTTLFCNENGYYAIYNSDRYGFNNEDKVWEQEITDFVLLGDSFVHGACVNRDDNIASILKDLNNKNIINLGYAGNGPLIELATLKEYAPKSTNNIIWFFYEGNDIKDLSKEIGNEILKSYFYDKSFTQDLKNKQDIIDEISSKALKYFLLDEINKKENSINVEKKTSLKDNIKLSIKLINIRKLIKNKFRNDNETILNVFRKVKDFSSKNGSNLHIVYLPQYERYLKGFNISEFNANDNYSLIKSITKQLDINLIDTHKDVFSKVDNPLSLFASENFIHYNELGYKLVALSINEYFNN